MLAISLVVALGMVGLQLLSPVPLKILFDNVFGGETLTWLFSDRKGEDLLVVVAAMMVLIVIAREIYTMAQEYIFTVFTQKIDRAIQLETLDAINQIPDGSSDNKKPGEYVFAVTTESQQMSQLILVNVVTVIGALITIAVIAWLMFRIDAGLMFASLAVFPPAVLIVYFVGSRLDAASEDTESSHAKVFSFVTENASKVRLIQSFALESVQRRRLGEHVRARNVSARKQTFLSSLLASIDEIVLAIATGAIVYIGGNGFFDGDVKIGELLLFIAYLDFLYAPFAMIIGAIASAKEMNAGLRRTHSIIETAERLKLADGDVSADGLTGHIEFKDAAITYGDAVLLKNVNLAITPGQLVAIIGPSGAGKSSLIDSIIRTVPVAAGTIELDAVSLNTYNLQSLRKNIAIVDQQSDLLAMSIGDNIALHDMQRENNASDIMKGALFAELHDFIEDSEGRYEHAVDSASLSGGQKQRVNLARSYYKDAPIILMDEPTSALDKVASEKLKHNIKELLAGRTRLIVTHDLDLIDAADRVLLVKDGAVQEVTGASDYKELLQ